MNAQPQAIVAIARPGLAVDGRYYKMHGEDGLQAGAATRMIERLRVLIQFRGT